MIIEKDGAVKTIEIKADNYYSTGNYYAEIIANTNKNTLGCWYKTQSDYIAYYFVEQKELHLIPTQKAQDYVKKNEDKFKVVSAPTTSTQGQLYYKNKGLLVNRTTLQKEMDIEIISLVIKKKVIPKLPLPKPPKRRI